MQLLETGLFDRHGFTRLHVAGHPEGNRDIDPDGGNRAVDEAVRWKQAFAERTGAKMALVTQFAFDAGAVTAWAERLEAAGVNLPIHVGIAGPAKLQTLIKFAVACGVGPSMSVLQKRARDVTKLLMPYEPDEVLAGLQRLSGEPPDQPDRASAHLPAGRHRRRRRLRPAHDRGRADRTEGTPRERRPPMTRTALVISAHAADFVWRCGGAIALHAAEGRDTSPSSAYPSASGAKARSCGSSPA